VSIHKIDGQYVDHSSNIDHGSNILYKCTVVVVVVSTHEEMLGVVKCYFVFKRWVYRFPLQTSIS
jgi:hypothetical protein